MLTFLWDYPLQVFNTMPSHDVHRGLMLLLSGPTHAIGYGRQPAPWWQRGSYIQTSFYEDFYEHLHASSLALTLGNLIGEQRRQLRIWNAYRRSRILESITVENGDGIIITGQAEPPVHWAPQQERAYTVIISTDGPAIVDAVIDFAFDDDQHVEVDITGVRIISWAWVADWGSAVRERLSWLTEILRTRRGVAQRRRLRQRPRRYIEFDVVSNGQDRRALDAALYDWSSRTWALPICADIRMLPAGVPAGTSVIEIDTAGTDFIVDGLAMIWLSTLRYELVTVSEVRADRVVLAHPVLATWPPGCRIYPVRMARLDGDPRKTALSDDIDKLRPRFRLTDPADWPTDRVITVYRGFPVFDWRPEVSRDPEASYARITTTIDAETSTVAVLDRPNMSFREDSMQIIAAGRDEQDLLKRWLYALAGRYRVAWLPSWSADLQLALPASAADSGVVVEWSGYTRFGRGQPNRRDLRIELHDGAVYYRRIIGYGETVDGYEQLTLDAVLGRTIMPTDVRLISFLSLSALASDDIDIDHVTDSDGLAQCILKFSGEPYDV